MEDQNYPKPGSTVSGVQDTDDSVVAPPPVVSLRDYLDTKIGRPCSARGRPGSAPERKSGLP